MCVANSPRCGLNAPPTNAPEPTPRVYIGVSLYLKGRCGSNLGAAPPALPRARNRGTSATSAVPPRTRIAGATASSPWDCARYRSTADGARLAVGRSTNARFWQHGNFVYARTKSCISAACRYDCRAATIPRALKRSCFAALRPRWAKFLKSLVRLAPVQILRGTQRNARGTQQGCVDGDEAKTAQDLKTYQAVTVDRRFVCIHGHVCAQFDPASVGGFDVAR